MNAFLLCPIAHGTWTSWILLVTSSYQTTLASSGGLRRQNLRWPHTNMLLYIYGPHLIMGDTHIFLATSYSRRAIISQVSAFHSASQATPVHLTLLRFFRHSSHLSTVYQKQQRIHLKLFEWTSWILFLGLGVKYSPHFSLGVKRSSSKIL